MKDPNHLASNHRKTIADNRLLRRQNKRLRKELQKFKRMVNEMAHLEEFQDFISSRSPENPIPDKLKCPECGAPAKEMDLGIWLYHICEECNWRERKQLGTEDS